MKIKVFGAIALLALTGCSSSDDIDTVPDNSKDQTEDVAIGFSSYLGNSVNTRAMGTRAEDYTGGEIDDATLATVGFGVFAYYTNTNKFAQNTYTPNFMYNTDVTKSGDNWTYTPLRYWPNPTNGSPQYVSFFAYAPYFTPSSTTPTSGITGLSANDATSDPTVTYTLNITNPVDLLWGTKTTTSSSTTPEVNKDLTKADYTNAKVGFTFKHALAKIVGASTGITINVDPDDGFTNDGSDANTRVTVENVSISVDNTTLYTSGTFDFYNGSWTYGDKGTSTTSLFTASDDIISTIKEPAAGTTLVNDEKTAWADDKLTGVTKTPVALTTGNTTLNTFYAIPGSNPKFTVTITYIVRTLDSSLATGYTEVKQTVVKDLELGSVAANKQYTISNISIGLNSVKFDAKVDSWAAETDSEAHTLTID